jgi:hypothetical protein
MSLVLAEGLLCSSIMRKHRLSSHHIVGYRGSFIDRQLCCLWGLDTCSSALARNILLCLSHWLLITCRYSHFDNTNLLGYGTKQAMTNQSKKERGYFPKWMPWRLREFTLLANGLDCASDSSLVQASSRACNLLCCFCCSAWWYTKQFMSSVAVRHNFEHRSNAPWISGSRSQRGWDLLPWGISELGIQGHEWPCSSVASSTYKARETERASLHRCSRS